VRRLGLALPATLLLLGACATLAGLESPGPSPTLPSDQDGGSLPVNDAGAVISPARLAIESNCRQAAETAEITIKNTKTTADITFKVVSTNTSILTLLDSQGAPRSEISGTVAPTKVERIKTRVTSTTPGNTAVDIDVTTDGVTQQVRAELVIKGGLITLTPPLVDFGQVRQNKLSPPQDIVITNTGNVAVTIESWPLEDGGADFTMQSGSVTVMPGTPATRSATFLPGVAGNPLVATFVPKLLEPICTDPPALTLKGQRVSTSVTVTPGTLTFPNVNCGGTPPPANLEIRNYSLDAATYTIASLRPPSRFSFPPSGSLNPGSDANPTVGTITITPLAANAPPGDFEEPIRIHVEGPESSDKDILLRYQVRGALLQVTPGALNGYNASGQVQSFRVTNVGNEFVFLDFQSSSASFGFDDTSSAGVWQAPGDFFEPNRADIRVKLNATAQGPHSSVISMTRRGNPPFTIPPYPDNSGALCNSPTISVSGAIP
jgi:hypothetical protein